jgi:hypothetical protein
MDSRAAGNPGPGVGLLDSKGRRPGGRPRAEQANAQPTRKAAITANEEGMAHALREGTWKLTMNIEDKPAALYNLAEDLGEKNNLIDNPAQAER